MVRIRHILEVVCYFLLLQTTLGKNVTHQHILDILNINENISHEEEQKLALELTGLLETFLEFSELALQMNQEVDQWMSGNDEISMEFESYIETCDITRTTFLEMKVAMDDALHDHSKRIALFSTYIPQRMAKIEPYIVNANAQYLELNKKNGRFLEKMLEKSRLSVEMLEIMISHMKKIGIEAGTVSDPETADDEEAVYARGRIITKITKLFLFYFKKLEASSEKLEKLGYFNSTNENNEETVNSDTIERELAIVEETKEMLFSVISESSKVLGPRNLMSFALDMIKIKNKKLDAITEEFQKRSAEGLQKMQLVLEAQADFDHSLSRYKSLRDEF